MGIVMIMEKSLKILDLGMKNYSETYALQMELAAQRMQGSTGDVLLLVEHPPVITLGRGGSYRHLLLSGEKLQAHGIEMVETNRGGDITYHGPGQLVGYPILQLEGDERDLHQLARNYEEAIIRTLALFSLAAERLEGCTGVWVGNEKIAAIGVGVKSWVTFHGFALNVNVDLTPFSYIVPCGLHGKGVTSMKALLGEDVDMQEIKNRLIESYRDVFQVKMLTIGGAL